MPLKFVGSAPSEPPEPPRATLRRPVEPFDRLPVRLREDSRLSDRAYRLYAAIVSHCWNDVRQCWPGNAALAFEIGGCSHDSVSRALKQLSTAGYIRCEPDASVRSNRMIYLLDPPEV